MRRLLLWCVAFGLMVAGAGADPVPAGLHLNWRFNTSSGVESGTWNVTFNVSRNPNCSDVIYSSTRNLSSASAGDLDVYLYGEAANFTGAAYLCLWRNQSFLYGIVNLTRFPRNVSPSQVMDDAPLNLTNLTATNLTADFFSANFSLLVTSRIQSWFAPLTDAALDVGNATLRFRDLYVSRNLTDGTAFVTIPNLSDAVNVTLDYARINATIGINATDTITDPAGSYPNTSLGSLANITNVSAPLTPLSGAWLRYNGTAARWETANESYLNTTIGVWAITTLTLRNYSNTITAFINSSQVNAAVQNQTLPPGGVNFTHLSNFTNDRNYTNISAISADLQLTNGSAVITDPKGLYENSTLGPLDNLTNVSVTHTPGAEAILQWNSTAGVWVALNGSDVNETIANIANASTNTITDPAGLYQNASNPLTANWATGNFSLAQNSLRVNATGNPDPFNVTANESSLVLHPNGTLTLAVNTTLINHSQTLRTDDSHGLLVETASGTDLFRIDTVSALIYSRTFRPTSSAAYTLGQSGVYWLDLFLSRNLTDGTYWATAQNLTEAAWHTLNVTRAGLLLNSSGSHNVSVSSLAAFANTSRTLLNSSQESDYVNRTGSNMTGPLNMTGNAIGNISNLTLGPHMLTWNQSCLIVLANGTGQTNYCA